MERAELRYVVLHHTGIENAHFDLMFETAPGSALATWRSQLWPPSSSEPLEMLVLHRADYLTYEGAISRNRGFVARVERGMCFIEQAGDEQWIIRLTPESGHPELAIRLSKSIVHHLPRKDEE